jgi:hypothetical protein
MSRLPTSILTIAFTASVLVSFSAFAGGGSSGSKGGGGKACIVEQVKEAIAAHRKQGSGSADAKEQEDLVAQLENRCNALPTQADCLAEAALTGEFRGNETIGACARKRSAGEGTVIQLGF